MLALIGEVMLPTGVMKLSQVCEHVGQLCASHHACAQLAYMLTHLRQFHHTSW